MVTSMLRMPKPSNSDALFQFYFSTFLTGNFHVDTSCIGNFGNFQQEIV